MMRTSEEFELRTIAFWCKFVGGFSGAKNLFFDVVPKCYSLSTSAVRITPTISLLATLARELRGFLCIANFR
jgi:hypothetical protein